MRGTTLTPPQVMRELERLLRLYKRPEWAPDDVRLFADDYVRICDDISAEQFTQAVTTYMKSAARFFPRPGELRTLAQQQPGATLPGEGTSFMEWWHRGYRDSVEGDLTPCPACGRGWQCMPRLVCVHDHARHRMMGLPCIGNCDGPQCIGPGTIVLPITQHGTRGSIWLPEAAAVAS